MTNLTALYLVATPIGNLEDITLRASEILKEVPIVVCEDTRVTKKLLVHLGSSAQLVSFHAHSSDRDLLYILSLLQSGKSLAYVTDAGTPGISDPGNELVSFIRKSMPEVKIVPIPGASALGALASVSGLNLKEFTFAGFVPKKKTKGFFLKLLNEGRPFVYYDSPHRVVKNLEMIITLESGMRECVVGREMTKMYETIYSGSVETVHELLQSSASVKGELAIVIGK